jgi:hypothetical protein
VEKPLKSQTPKNRRDFTGLIALDAPIGVSVNEADTHKSSATRKSTDRISEAIFTDSVPAFVSGLARNVSKN